MANTKQARKRARQAVARNQHLSAQRSQYRTAIKAVRKLIVANLSSEPYELKPGDLIMTGTPAGIGKIDRGDILEGGVQGVGVIKVKFGE